jgi:hypothetical protein
MEIRPQAYDQTMGYGHEVTEFSELVRMLQGMRSHMVEAMLFLPWDDAQFPVAAFSGTLNQIEFREGSRDPRWVLVWSKDGESKPHYPEIAIWERRFIRAELEFTGDPDEGLTEIDETRGHNIFLKIYSEGWILDLTSYV